MRLDSMDQFLRCAMSRNPVVPAPGHMHTRIKEKHPVGEEIASTEIIEEPPVDGIMFAKHPLDLEYSLFTCEVRHDRHLIVVVLERQ